MGSQPGALREIERQWLAAMPGWTGDETGRVEGQAILAHVDALVASLTAARRGLQRVVDEGGPIAAPIARAVLAGEAPPTAPPESVRPDLAADAAVAAALMKGRGMTEKQAVDEVLRMKTPSPESVRQEQPDAADAEAKREWCDCEHLAEDAECLHEDPCDAGTPFRPSAPGVAGAPTAPRQTEEPGRAFGQQPPNAPDGDAEPLSEVERGETRPLDEVLAEIDAEEDQSC